MNRRHAVTIALLATAGSLIGAAPAWAGPSVFLTAPPDASAVTVQGVGNGKADDGPAIQKALDAAANGGAGGIVYLPSGRYRITGTLFIWPGVRLIGVGATRPLIVLGDNTPGFQEGVKNMLFFAGRGPGPQTGPFNRKPPFSPPGTVPADDSMADANPGSFYPGISNVDIKVGKGNPATAAIREHAAQHAFLKHMDFDLGDAFAGIYMVGNEGEDLHFKGGRYGIVAEKPSPAWPYTLLDSTFEGQRDAAIREHEAGLTMANVTFRNVPVAIEIDEGYGDWLYGQDLRFENVSKAGVIISNEENAYTQVSFDNVLATGTPVFARLRESGKTFGQKGSYKVTEFTHGLTLPAMGAMGQYETRFNAAPAGKLPAAGPEVIRDLPPTSQWVNVMTLGAKGDGKTDDTAALQAAIAAHKVLYFPSGFYSVTDTLKLKPDTVLIGLHPSTTQIVLPDGTKAFQGIGTPKGLIEAPRGGDNIVTGLGLHTRGINPRASALLWRSGANSLVDDVKIQGGHGTFSEGGARFNPYGGGGEGRDASAEWDQQYHSIWVTDGGGGTFANIWSPDTNAQSGFYISDTTTPGKVFQLSNEHHSRLEIGLNRAENWQLFGPQTEEEVRESANAVSLSIRNSRNILVANYHGYRVTRTRKPAPAAVLLENVSDIRFRNVHVNAESGLGTCDQIGCTTFLRASKFPYENAIIDVTHGIQVREREFTVLDVPAKPSPPARQGPAVTQLADDFWSISGGAIAPDGSLWFVEREFNRIWKWSEAGGLVMERDATTAPVNLAIDKSGNVMVLSTEGPAGTVYSFKPGSPETQMTILEPRPVASSPTAEIAIPGNWWNNGEFKDQYDPKTDRFTTLAEMFARDVAEPNAEHYVSPDGSLALPAWRTFQQGPGVRWSPGQQTYGYITGKPGDRVYISNESEDRTYSGILRAGGAVTDLKMLANRGGESVAQGPDGRVYVANGQIFVYTPDGAQTGRIDVPERPLQLLFGGSDGRTLYIITHHALYSVRP